MKSPQENWTLNAKLFLVLDREASAPRSLAEITELAIDGGVDAVVLRMLDAPIRDILATGREIADICRKNNVPFILSHNPTLSQLLHPEGVHLGKRDIPIPDAKRVAPRGTAIGYSAHSVEEAKQALEAGADYVFLGPIFPTPSKLKYGPPLGVDIVKDIPAHLKERFVFIGGIDEKTLPGLLAQGANRIAVIRAICSAENVKEATRRLKAMLTSQDVESPTK